LARAAVDNRDHDPAGVASKRRTKPLGGAISFYAPARILQVGPGCRGDHLTSAAANLAAIIGTSLVFD
jgi:hypothetical protein